MIPERSYVRTNMLGQELKTWLSQDDTRRLGLLTSITGGEVVTVLLDPKQGSSQCLVSSLEDSSYHSLSSHIPQAHWFERLNFDLFGIYPEGHPRLKPVVLNEAYTGLPAPLCKVNQELVENLWATRDLSYLTVSGEGVYELPVGPVHAGIIEPGHFRLSCMGETVLNLEVRLGFLHRGVEKRLTEVPWHKARFVAEAASSDTSAANAICSARALESISSVVPPARAVFLRAMALEVERLAMHVFDVGGMAVDLGCISMAAAFSRLRGSVLRLADLLSGSRFLRGFVVPSGVIRDPDRHLSEFKKVLAEFQTNIDPLLNMFMDNPGVYDRLSGVGVLSHSLALEFGMVGVAARASGISYDVRQSFDLDYFPVKDFEVTVNPKGDALARTRVRVQEIRTSMRILEELLDSMPQGEINTAMPDTLPGDALGMGIAEAFRGELIHLVFTNREGEIIRYAIKDPSVNNWTGLAIAVRNNVVADFPVCNKSFALSYSGHDL